MAESSLICDFSVQISQEIIKLRKIGKRDSHIIFKVLPNEIIKKIIIWQAFVLMNRAI
jgi:hypothetical protein